MVGLDLGNELFSQSKTLKGMKLSPLVKPPVVRRYGL
jgi:hypothetical protein